MFRRFSKKAQKIKQASQQAQVQEILQIGKWNEGSQASDQAQANPIASRPCGRSLNIEALFRCKDCSPFASQFPFLSPLQKRLNLIRTHWCVDNEGVTRSWERPSNSPHRGSGFLGGVWMSIPAPWCMHSCELVTAFTQIRGQTQALYVLYRKTLLDLPSFYWCSGSTFLYTSRPRTYCTGWVFALLISKAQPGSSLTLSWPDTNMEDKNVKIYRWAHHSKLSIDVGVTPLNLRSWKLAYHLQK